MAKSRCTLENAAWPLDAKAARLPALGKACRPSSAKSKAANQFAARNRHRAVPQSSTTIACRQTDRATHPLSKPATKLLRPIGQLRSERRVSSFDFGEAVVLEERFELDGIVKSASHPKPDPLLVDPGLPKSISGNRSALTTDLGAAVAVLCLERERRVHRDIPAMWQSAYLPSKSHRITISCRAIGNDEVEVIHRSLSQSPAYLKVAVR
jgi:hypothetical protein